MTAPFGTQFRNTTELTDEQIHELALDGDDVANDHYFEHTFQCPDPDCPHCYWAGWLAYLDPFAERIGQC